MKRGEEVINQLLVQYKLKPKEDFEAIVASNSHQAKEVIRELRKRNINIPKQVAVTAINDDEELSSMTPTVTTVAGSFYMLGFRLRNSLIKKRIMRP